MTHLIVTHAPHDNATGDFAAALVDFCRVGGSATRVDRDVYAPKGSPDVTYLTAFAEFDQTKFVCLVHSIPWDYPSSVAAFVRRPGTTRFEPLDLAMSFDVGRERKLAAPYGWKVSIAGQQVRLLTDVYPALLDRRQELIRVSVRNPHFQFDDFGKVASIATEVPWAFECVRVYPERRMKSGRRREFGPGKDDWEWVNTEHRIINADLAVRGIYVRLMCDVAEVGPDVFDQVRGVAESLTPGAFVHVDGVVDVRGSGECVVEQIRRLERPAGEPPPDRSPGEARG